MKRTGILNPHLLSGMARLGHTDELVVCDAGLPIPTGPTAPIVVDLSLVAGTPTFAEVLDALLGELVVEGATAAAEIREHNPRTADLLTRHFPELALIPHEELKLRAARAKCVVRTGEATPYANVVLRSGVPF
ncbi:D-ribose pyranase [Streptomyces sp. AJS327]|uniref:D-ribose pyranase n=1 Tax=Streptomyces sp. AJS327 TaxID=2545265 RepID=UPI0015DF98DA|nr:D-ribose pyranase [Streptomyces sp. AJS327]MBA0053349.1 D-ribose pyranase [Streptomyces sp. AJS327]